MEESFDRGIKKGGRDTWREQYSTMLISSLDLVITSLFNFSGNFVCSTIHHSAVF